MTRRPPASGAWFRAAGLRHALIGGQALNVWVLPRQTDDYDFIVSTGRETLEDVRDRLLAEGLEVFKYFDEGQPSGPDGIRMKNPAGTFSIDLQVSKTAYQDLVIERAKHSDALDLEVATPEDLVILKLFAMRAQDQRDIAILVESIQLDREYIERWVTEWDQASRWKTFIA